MISPKKLIATAVVTAAAALPAVAYSQARGADTGFYVGASVGQSTSDCSVSGGSCDDKDTAYKIFAGYQFNRNLAVEGGYSPLGEVTADFGGLGSATFEANAWDLVAVGIWPINPQFSLYGKLGAYNAEVKGSGLASGKKSTTDLTYGVGAQYNFSRNLGLRAEWQRYGGLEAPSGGSVTVSGDSDVDVLSLGVVWKF